MKINELKFLLKLLDCSDYRSTLYGAVFKEFGNKEKICENLGKEGFVDFSREIRSAKITPPGYILSNNMFVGVPVREVKVIQTTIYTQEKQVLQKIKYYQKIETRGFRVPGVRPNELDEILQSLNKQGLVEVETKLKSTKPEVWLTQQGLECLYLVNNYFHSLRKSPGIQLPPLLLSDKPVNPPGSWSIEQEILQTLQDLDRQLGTENYLPIFHLRQKLQPPLSREQLDRGLYHLQQSNKIELSTVVHTQNYTQEQIQAGIPQISGGPLFFIKVTVN